MMMVIDCRDMSMRYRLHMSAGHSLSYVQSICLFGIASTDCIFIGAFAAEIVQPS